MPSGTYFQLNVKTSGRDGAGTVTVKARVKPGPPYVCLTCLVNECEHTAFVADHDTPDCAGATAPIVLGEAAA